MTTLHYVTNAICKISIFVFSYKCFSFLIDKIINNVPYPWLFIGGIFLYGSYVLYETN